MSELMRIIEKFFLPRELRPVVKFARAVSRDTKKSKRKK